MYLTNAEKRLNMHPVSNLGSKFLEKKKHEVWDKKFCKKYRIPDKYLNPGGSYDFTNQRKFYLQRRASAKIKSMQEDAVHYKKWVTFFKFCENFFAALAGITGILLNTNGGKTPTVYGVDTSPFENNSRWSSTVRMLSKSSLWSTTIMTVSSTFGASLLHRGYQDKKKIAYVTAMNLERILTKYNSEIIMEDEVDEVKMKEKFANFVLKFEEELSRERMHILESQLENANEDSSSNGETGKSA